jgi:hypothetical protein
MMRSFGVLVAVVVSALLVFTACTPTDAKKPQVLYNAKVSLKDTTKTIKVQLYDAKTKKLGAIRDINVTSQIVVPADSGSQAGAKVSLCRGSLVYLMDGQNLYTASTLENMTVQVLNAEVVYPPGDGGTICFNINYIGHRTPTDSDIVIPVSRINPMTSARIPGGIPAIGPGDPRTFAFSVCVELTDGSSTSLAPWSLIWMIDPESGIGTPYIIEAPMDVTVSGRIR